MGSPSSGRRHSLLWGGIGPERGGRGRGGNEGGRGEGTDDDDDDDENDDDDEDDEPTQKAGRPPRGQRTA